jgi:hypothetical protein
MKYIVTLDVEVEDRNTEDDVRRAIESVASQAESGWFGLTGDPQVTVRTVKIAESPTRSSPRSARPSQ